MKKYLAIVAFAAFGTGIWTGCSVTLDSENPDGTFACQTDDDCIDNFECKADNKCYAVAEDPSGTCLDQDGDGYGIGTDEERLACPQCTSLGRCEEDCNDTDDSIHPHAAEPCNNIDDNCNMEVDEPTACVVITDCSALDAVKPLDTGVSCGDTGFCEVRMAIQTCAPDKPGCPCNDDVFTCTAGAYPAVPDAGLCL